MPRRITYFEPRNGARDDRKKANAFYCSARWRRVRAIKIRHNPLCEPCQARGRITPAQQVHHVRDRQQFPALAFDLDNLESVCIPCHNAKRGTVR